MDRIEIIHIEVSTYCGANCVMCPHESYVYRNRNMDFGLFKKIVDESVALGVKTIIPGGMGDSFMDPGLEKKLAYIKESYPQVQTVLSTTGHIINIDLMKYVDILKFSFYGATKKGYESVHRGVVNFEESLENIEKVLALPDGKKPYTHMQYLILPENEDETEEWKAYWESKNVDELWIWKPSTWPGFYDYGRKPDFKNAIPCNRVFHPAMLVKVNGLVSVCCYDYDNKLTLGDLTKNTLQEVLHENALLKELQEVHSQKAFENCKFKVCAECDQIEDRTHALVYSSKDRKIGAIALAEKDEFRY